MTSRLGTRKQLRFFYSVRLPDPGQTIPKDFSEPPPAQICEENRIFHATTVSFTSTVRITKKLPNINGAVILTINVLLILIVREGNLGVIFRYIYTWKMKMRAVKPLIRPLNSQTVHENR